MSAFAYCDVLWIAAHLKFEEKPKSTKPLMISPLFTQEHKVYNVHFNNTKVGETQNIYTK